jgi:4-amino-4-deoxy-L-arabinose transferase-like glycosyltransferase
VLVPPANPPAAVRRGKGWGLALLVTAVLGLGIFVLRLGEAGLVDETPPLFAGAARAMAETGDWLTPRVNGLPRYDKPPLVYWLMGLVYALPGHSRFDPLGSWAAGLPSALSSIGVMLALCATLLRWPQPSPGPGGERLPRRPARSAVVAALAFALSPLVLLWGRIGVSDALLSGCLAVSLLLLWQAWADPARPWWPGWLVLGLAVLAKGPVAVVLAGLTLAGFGWHQGILFALWARLKAGRGLVVTALVAVPWYAAMLVVEGKPFWDSFFGYHNLQRFSSVVNDHLQPWWFFLPVLVIASLPFTPLLLLGLKRGLARTPQAPQHSLRSFAAWWLLAVLVFFTMAATKLPSYWLPATPAAGLLIALAAQDGESGGRDGERHSAGVGRWFVLAQAATVLLTATVAVALWASSQWIPLIQDPEMPTLAAELTASVFVGRAALFWTLAALVGLLCLWRVAPGWLLGLQLPLVAFHLFALLPLWQLGDGVRQRPVREMAASVQRQIRPSEGLAMVGVLKPSLHYYTGRVVIYEGVSASGMVNLSDRLRHERREGQRPSTRAEAPTVLVVIDQNTSQRPYWRAVQGQELDRSGIYRLWRVDRARLESTAAALLNREEGRLSWRDPRPERY